MEEKKTYYDWLFEESEEEKEIGRLFDEELERFKNSEEYKRHDAVTKDLFEKLKEAGKKRREIAKQHRPRRQKAKKIDMSEFKRKNEEEYQKRFNAYPEALKQAITAFNALSEDERRVFHNDTWMYEPKYEKLENPKTTENDIKELLEILVQTTIDFIDERGLTDIDGVSFGADGLGDSAKHGEWISSTDASIHVTGWGKGKSKDGTEFDVIKLIGNYM